MTRRRTIGISWPKRIALLVLVLLVLATGYGAGLYFWAGSKLTKTDAFTRYAGRPADGKGTDWLLIGSDSRSSLTREQREKLHVGNDGGLLNTDTLMILHYGESGPYLISVPRDSYVEIPGHGKHKINNAYALGGAQLLTRTVEQATGLRLDHYAEVDFLGLVDVVDALGGVEICVPAGGLHDEKSGADFGAGCREMNGVQALAYVRARYSDPLGDLGRVKRQQQLVSAVAQESTDASVLLDPWTLIPFVSTALSALTVDRESDVGELSGMAWRARGLAGGGSGGTETATGTTTATTTVPVTAQPRIPGVGDVVVWDKKAAEKLFGALRDDAPLAGTARRSVGF